jgi:hypothetical protein
VPWCACHRSGMPPTKEDFTVKLIRLLAPLAMLVAGLAAPATATAADPPERLPMRPDALRAVCAAIAGTYSEGERIAPSCQVGDGTILCDDRLCRYNFTTESRDLPPLKAPCELARGTISDIVAAQISCEIKEGVITVNCELVPQQTPWWAYPRGREYVIVCDVRWIPSEQPMT